MHNPAIDTDVKCAYYLRMNRVQLTPEAARQLDELPKKIHARMLQLLSRLQSWPRVSGAKLLKGNLAGHYRMRSGDYRLQFRVQRTERLNTILIERIGHRDGFYED